MGLNRITDWTAPPHASPPIGAWRLPYHLNLGGAAYGHCKIPTFPEDSSWHYYVALLILLLSVLPYTIGPNVRLSMSMRLAAWRSGNGVGRINEVTVRRARLVLRWVTCPDSTPGGDTLFQYVTANQGQLSLSSFRGR